MAKKIIIGVGLLALIVVGWFMFQGSTVEYVATVDDEVSALEADLAALEAAIEAGELTPAEAAEAQRRIAARVDAINSAVESSGRAKLTEGQRQQLLGGLDRLKTILTDYRATLIAVDEAVLTLPADQRPVLKKRRGGGGGGRSIIDVIREAVDIVEDHVEDVIEDYVPEEVTESGDETLDVDEETATSSEEASEDTEDTEMGDFGDESEETEETSPNDDTQVSDDTESSDQNGTTIEDTSSEEEATTTP